MSEAQLNMEERQKGALLIAASRIAAIRLRGAPIDNSPKTVAQFTMRSSSPGWSFRRSHRREARRDPSLQKRGVLKGYSFLVCKDCDVLRAEAYV
jgi:hypothetical protein